MSGKLCTHCSVKEGSIHRSSCPLRGTLNAPSKGWAEDETHEQAKEIKGRPSTRGGKNKSIAKGKKIVQRLQKMAESTSDKEYSNKLEGDAKEMQQLLEQLEQKEQEAQEKGMEATEETSAAEEAINEMIEGLIDEGEDFDFGDDEDDGISEDRPQSEVDGSEAEEEQTLTDDTDDMSKKNKEKDKTKKPKKGMNEVGSAYVHENLLTVLRACVENNLPALLVGETGTGKTTIIRELAKEEGKNLIRVSVNGTTSIEEIIGKWLAKDGTTIWQDGILVSAIKNGDWIVFDELNAALPEILFSLHSLLDDDRKLTIIEKDNEVIFPHEEFRFFGTMNPTEDYAGTKDLNRALVSRFHAIINVYPLGEKDEHALLVGVHGVEDSIATTLVMIGTELRNKKKKDEILYFCSTRDLVQAGKLANNMPLNLACQVAIFNKMTNDEREVVKVVAGMAASAHVVAAGKGYKELIEELEVKDREIVRLMDAQKKTADEFKLKSEMMVKELISKITGTTA